MYIISYIVKYSQIFNIPTQQPENWQTGSILTLVSRDKCIKYYTIKNYIKEIPW